MSNLNKDLDNVLRTVSITVNRLGHLANAFHTVGNTQLHEQLSEMAQQLESIPNEVKDLVYNNTMEELNKQTAIAGNVLEQMLELGA